MNHPASEDERGGGPMVVVIGSFPRVVPEPNLEPGALGLLQR